MKTEPKFRRAARIATVVSLLSVVMMGQRRPSCDTSVNPTIYGRGTYLSPLNQSVSFQERATHDIQGNTGSLPANFTTDQTMVYVGDEDSILYYFPTTPSLMTVPEQWLGLSYQVFGNHVAGNTLVNGEQPPAMTTLLSAAPSGAIQPFLIRQYDRGNCSWFVGAQSFGGVLAQALDSFVSLQVTTVNQARNSDLVLAATGVWHFRLAIDAGTWTQGQPPVAVSTNDRYEYFREYYIYQTSGSGYDTVWVVHSGRLFADAASGQIRSFVNNHALLDSSMMAVVTLPAIQDDDLLSAFRSQLASIHSAFAAFVGQRFAQELSWLSLPSPVRVSMMPSGPDVVLSEQSGDAGDVSLLQHGQRANYCGASRAQPVVLSGISVSRVGSGSFSWQSGWTW